MKTAVPLIISFLLSMQSFAGSSPATSSNDSQADGDGRLAWSPVRFAVREGYSLPAADLVGPLNFDIWEKNDFDALPDVFGLSLGGINAVKNLDGFSLGILGAGGKELNGLSIGSLATYGKNVNGVSIGGTIIDFSEEVNGFALGPVYSRVQGDSNGILIGGLSAVTEKNTDGIVFSALFIKGKNLNGISFSSGVLFSERSRGLSFGALFNALGQCDGMQTGLLNFIREPVAIELRHLIGAKSYEPSFASQLGILNWTGAISKETKRGKTFPGKSEEQIPETSPGSLLQIGLVNVSREGRGLQIGLLNFMEDGFIPCFPLFNF